MELPFWLVPVIAAMPLFFMWLGRTQSRCACGHEQARCPRRHETPTPEKENL